MDPEILCDRLEGHPFLALPGDADDVVVELLRIRLGHGGILSGPLREQAMLDVTATRGRPQRWA